MIHRNSHTSEAGSSSTTIRYRDWNSGLVLSSEEDQYQDGMCGLQDLGGHIMKVPIVGFQVLLCMRLEVYFILVVIMATFWIILEDVLWQIHSGFTFQGTPPSARDIPIPVLFSPIFLLQGAGVLFSASRLIEKIVLLLRSGAETGSYFTYSSRVHDCFGFLHHGSR